MAWASSGASYPGVTSPAANQLNVGDANHTGRASALGGGSFRVLNASGGVVGALTVSGNAGVLTLSGALGIFSHTVPSSQPVLATGASHTADDVIALLQSYGFCKQS